ncbi:hypothetical protein VTO73DRAFT_10165 [Trametes versicolor]
MQLPPVRQVLVTGNVNMLRLATLHKFVQDSLMFSSLDAEKKHAFATLSAANC